MVRVYSAGSLVHVRRSAVVRPDVRWRPVRPGGRAAMAASSPASAAFSLFGRLWQCGQQVSAVIAARARDSTAGEVTQPGVMPAVAGARVAGPRPRLLAGAITPAPPRVWGAEGAAGAPAAT